MRPLATPLAAFVVALIALVALVAGGGCSTPRDPVEPDSGVCTPACRPLPACPRPGGGCNEPSLEAFTCADDATLSEAACVQSLWCVRALSGGAPPAGACPASPPIHGSPCNAGEGVGCAYACGDPNKGGTVVCNGGLWCGVVPPACTLR